MEKRYRYVPDWAYYFGVMPVLAALPRHAGYRLARAQGNRVSRSNPAHLDEAVRMLRGTAQAVGIAPGREEQIALQVFETLAYEDLDTYYFPFWNSGNIRDYFDFQGLEHLDRALAGKRGVLLYTAHFGSVCAPVVALSLAGYSLNQLSRDSRGEENFIPAYRKYARLKIGWMTRRMSGQFLLIESNRGVYSSASSAAASLRAYQLLRTNQIVSMAIDVPPALVQAAAPVTFLGRACRFPTGLISLAHSSGAPVLPFFCRRDPAAPERQTLSVGEPLQITGDVCTDLAGAVGFFEQALRRDPGQWLCWDSLSAFLA